MTPRVRSSLIGAAAGLSFAALFAVLLQISPSLFGLEWLWGDHWVVQAAAERDPSSRIAIITVNDKSIDSLAPFYGRPPWTRELMARVVEEVERGGGRVIVFDILFGEENRNDPAGDRRFARALETMPAVLGSQTARTGPDLVPDAWAETLWQSAGAPSIEPQRLTPPHPLFASGAATGTMRFRVEEGASVARRYGTLQPVPGGRWVPSLALAAAARLNDLPQEAEWQPGRGSSWKFRAGEMEIPVDREGTFGIRWYGEKQKSQPAVQENGATRLDQIGYPVVDFDRVILASLAREDGSIPEEEIDAFVRQQFEGKAVFVGYTATGLFDLRATPLSPVTAGVEIHANALDNLLHSDVLRSAPPLLVIAAMILVAALFGALAYGIDSQAASAALFAVTVSAWLFAVPLALRRGIIFPAAAPALAITGTWIVLTVARYVAEQKRSSLLKGTFGRYVSPQVLDYLLENPDKVRLGGERRDLTILFSDIRGFTSISEASEPEEVVEMLNEYLTRMVEILLRHGGTLDKFIGDAVMGFWNAPTRIEDHPRRAVLCAIEMIEETARLRAAWEAEGKPALRIGIGLNTGEAVVGNIGSSRVFGYTVIGDAVNLASRLEGKNKDYGTGIIISESTKLRMGEGIPAFYLDEVQVKGKQQPVKIFEIRGQTP